MDDLILLPNEQQREALCDPMHPAFLEIRLRCCAGKAEPPHQPRPLTCC